MSKISCRAYIEYFDGKRDICLYVSSDTLHTTIRVSTEEAENLAEDLQRVLATVAKHTTEKG